MKKLTPLLTVDDIESCLPFWVERLGFGVTVQVPGEAGLAFAILDHGGIEVMLQTRVSVEADDANLAAELSASRCCLYLEVESIDDVERRLEGVEVVVPRRTTFYGSTEIFVRDPAGNVIGFSQPGQAEGEPADGEQADG